MAGKRTKARRMSGITVAPAPARRGKTDRRIVQTRDMLGDALVALLHERPLDEINVQHVLERAGVARSTFYAHFTDKNDLLFSDAEDFFEMMSSLLTRRREASNRVAPVYEYFWHVAEQREFLASLIKSGKAQEIFEMGEAYFARGIAKRLAALPAARSLSGARRVALAHGCAGAMSALLRWWLNHTTLLTAQQMDDLFHRMVWCGIVMPARRATGG
jgi:AcrR family transcriptional regulator